eukprot:349583-Chlamydomonas_euryale.AAC.5
MRCPVDEMPCAARRMDGCMGGGWMDRRVDGCGMSQSGDATAIPTCRRHQCCLDTYTARSTTAGGSTGRASVL